MTFSHTVSGTNTLLLVQVYIQANGSSDTVKNLTFNGTAMTLVLQDRDTRSGTGDLETWRLVNPASGTHNVVVTINDTTARVLHAGALSYRGVNQSSPIGANTFSDQGSSTSHSLSLTTTSTNSLLVGMCTSYGTGTGITPGSGQLQKWLQTDNNETEGDDKATSTAGSYNLSYNLSSSHSADLLAVEVKAANTSCIPVGAAFPLLNTSAGSETSSMEGTVTSTPTVAPTPKSPLTVMARPNVSRDGAPVHFNFNLAKPAAIHLVLFALTGEQVYQAQATGAAGSNDILWDLRNSVGSPVSSGLYVYVLTADDGEANALVMGKVAIIH